MISVLKSRPSELLDIFHVSKKQPLECGHAGFGGGLLRLGWGGQCAHALGPGGAASVMLCITGIGLACAGGGWLIAQVGAHQQVHRWALCPLGLKGLERGQV